MRVVKLMPMVMVVLGLAQNAIADAIRVELKTGDVLYGETLRETDEQMLIRHPLLGDIGIPRDDIKTFAIGAGAIAKAQTPQPAKVVKVEPPKHADGGLLGLGWLKDWDRRLEAGVSGASGVSSNQQAHVGFMADYEDPQVRWQQRARFFRSESEGDETANSAMVSINRDDLMPGSPWFSFAGGRFDRDEFQDWRNRVAINGGVGLQMVKTERYRLLGRLGLGATHSWGGPEGQNTAPEGLLGFDMDWKVSKQQSVALANTLYPSLKHSGEFRNVTTFDWIIDLDKEAGLGLKLGVVNEHESEREDGLDKNDFKYTSALIWRL
ncbi:DUF481 domain-containing protein [Nitrogeniibacter aestuarii]|uniref:DUF481 domain-containing protein n=1 Tax=Nitrogeniibacter aestuarii TaxID=2815343 RepID=UPI001D0FB047|nr:DUF481 domain-containing protein [Nitrogeniibacter aestuarii]